MESAGPVPGEIALRVDEQIPADGGWNDRIAALPNAHVLQTAAWARVKAHTGWRPLFLSWEGAGGAICAAALVLERRQTLLPGFAARVLYAPRGPLLDWSDAPLRRRVLDDLSELARRRGAFFIKIDPDAALGYGVPQAQGDRPDPTGAALSADLLAGGWHLSAEQVQFRNTVVIDLQPSLDAVLDRMKSKTRYNIRLAERKGVRVRPASPADFPSLYRMYAETAARDNFVIRDEAYYLHAWGEMHAAGLAAALVAEVESEPVAAVIVYHFGGSGWYMHGMSTPLHRERMPNHLLQWEAMRLLKEHGCLQYDLWGAPDVFDESDPLWGVYRFKEGFGGEVRRGLGAWDFPARRLPYALYSRLLPPVLDVLRARGKQRTRKVVAAG